MMSLPPRTAAQARKRRPSLPRATRAARACLTAATTLAGATEPVFRRIGAEQGLVPEGVYGIAQDKGGFLGIGTEGGLFRYDGGEVRRWLSPRGNRPVSDPMALPSVEVVALEDHGIPVQVEGQTLETRFSPPRSA